MSNETIALLGLLISVVGLVVQPLVQIFGEDIRAHLIQRFRARPQPQGSADSPTPPPATPRKSAFWIRALLVILALISLVSLLKSLADSPDTVSAPAPKSAFELGPDAVNSLQEAKPPETAAPSQPAPPPNAEPQPFDWSQLRGDTPIWYRTARDAPLSIYVDAASVESPTPETRIFWAAAIPNRTTEGFRRVAYMKARYQADCARGTMSMGRPILYGNNGISIEHELQGDAVRDREVAPGTYGHIALRFVCSGPNENSIEVLRGGNLRDYLVPNITRAPE